MELIEKYLGEAKKIIKVYQNKDYGIESHVIKSLRGYFVSLVDTNSKKVLDTTWVIDNENDAHKKAKKWIKNVEPEKKWWNIFKKRLKE